MIQEISITEIRFISLRHLFLKGKRRAGICWFRRFKRATRPWVKIGVYEGSFVCLRASGYTRIHSISIKEASILQSAMKNSIFISLRLNSIYLVILIIIPFDDLYLFDHFPLSAHLPGYISLLSDTLTNTVLFSFRSHPYWSSSSSIS